MVISMRVPWPECHGAGTGTRAGDMIETDLRGAVLLLSARAVSSVVCVMPACLTSVAVCGCARRPRGSVPAQPAAAAAVRMSRAAVCTSGTMWRNSTPQLSAAWDCHEAVPHFSNLPVVHRRSTRSIHAPTHPSSCFVASFNSVVRIDCKFHRATSFTTIEPF